MKLQIERCDYPLTTPFAITGRVFTDSATVRVSIEHEGHLGRGEGVGVYYTDETANRLISQLEGVADQVTCRDPSQDVRDLLPSGGARNALDCALWDLRCKIAGKSIFELLDIPMVRLHTFYTIGIASISVMADSARDAKTMPNIKIKLSNDSPVERVEAIRQARPDATLIVDANQAWTLEELREFAPHLARLGVKMIEQPLARGGDRELRQNEIPILLGGDESCLDLSELDHAKSRYGLINIKLDKTGGLTEALELSEAARSFGLKTMVGNMIGTSLSMAPSYLVGQTCTFVDIDGPLLLENDIEHGLQYSEGGMVSAPTSNLWG